MERETGFEPATPSLEGLRSSQLSYSRTLFLIANFGFINMTPSMTSRNPACAIEWWGGEVSNLRRLTPTDLQSVPFGHSGTSPTFTNINRIGCNIAATSFALSKKTNVIGYVKWSHRRDSNPRQADYKSATLPTELRWRNPLRHTAPPHRAE
jgi:hypothetical protein